MSGESRAQKIYKYASLKRRHAQFLHPRSNGLHEDVNKVQRQKTEDAIILQHKNKYVKSEQERHATQEPYIHHDWT